MGRSSEDDDEFKPDLNAMLPHSKEANQHGHNIYLYTGDAYANEWSAEEEWHVPDQ